MFKTFQKISQTNVDFHANHPAAATALAVTTTIVAIAGVNLVAKILSRPDTVNNFYVKPMEY